MRRRPDDRGGHLLRRRGTSAAADSAPDYRDGIDCCDYCGGVCTDDIDVDDDHGRGHIYVRRDDYDAVVAALATYAELADEHVTRLTVATRRLVNNVTANDRPATGHIDVTAGSRPAAGDDDHPPNR